MQFLPILLLASVIALCQANPVHINRSGHGPTRITESSPGSIRLTETGKGTLLPGGRTVHGPVQINESGRGSVRLTEQGKGSLARAPVRINERGPGGVFLNERGRGNMFGRKRRDAEAEGRNPMAKRSEIHPTLLAEMENQNARQGRSVKFSQLDNLL